MFAGQRQDEGECWGVDADQRAGKTGILLPNNQRHPEGRAALRIVRFVRSALLLYYFQA